MYCFLNVSLNNFVCYGGAHILCNDMLFLSFIFWSSSLSRLTVYNQWLLSSPTLILDLILIQFRFHCFLLHRCRLDTFTLFLRLSITLRFRLLLLWSLLSCFLPFRLSIFNLLFNLLLLLIQLYHLTHLLIKLGNTAWCFVF